MCREHNVRDIWFGYYVVLLVLSVPLGPLVLGVHLLEVLPEIHGWSSGDL